MYALILTMVAMQGNVSNMGHMAVTYDASVHILMTSSLIFQELRGWGQL